MRISTETENRKQRKNAATDKKCILWKMDLKFPNPKLTLLFIYHMFWYKIRTLWSEEVDENALEQRKLAE